MGCNRTLTLFTLFILSCSYLPAQNITPMQQDSAAGCIDISKIHLSRTVSDKVAVSFIDHRASLPEVFSSLTFNKNASGFVPNKLVTKKAITRFAICNSADTTISLWYFPGFYYWKVQLYQLKGRQLLPLPVIVPENTEIISYRKISLAAHDSMTIIAELTFAKTYLNSICPRLIHPGYLESFIIELRNTRSQTNILTYIFCGLLLMMILYSLANFFQGANKDFLYYSGYAFFIGLMLLLKAIYNFLSTPISLFQDEYLDFVMQDIGYLFYMIFMQKYLMTKTRHPFLCKIYNTGIGLTIISALSYTYFHYLSDNFVAENLVENLTKFLLLFLNVVFLIYSFRHWNDKLLRYLFWGNLCLLIFSVISQWAIMSDHIVRKLPGVFQSSLFYYEIGVFLELVFFLMALNHKSRRELIYQARERERLKAENQMKEYEKELAVFKAQQQERERISADMHDELGSGMTAIRLMSEIARNKMKQDTPAEIEKISQSADEVLNKMNAIIWSMNSGNDTIDNLVSYIRSYALEYFENTPIDCKVITPDFIEPKELTGDKRRNIFLCVKETLNNALKHSKASLIKIDFTIDDNLEIRIADNGVGIDLEKIRQFGNGLKNISRRMESIGGTYHIESNAGTVTTLTLPL
jgi:signal transduction histidine kinase